MITLTEQMIRDFGLTGAMAGEIATPEDMAIMGMGKVSPTTSTTPDIRPKIRPDLSTNSTVPNVPEPVTPKAAPAPAASTDPYSNLSDLQRRMLRFAAIKDAGMALQGKEGNAVATVMGDITKRDDMARKAAAVQATSAANAALMQQAFGASGMSMSGATPEALRAQIDTLSQLAFSNPAMAPAISARIKVLQAEAERLTDTNKEIANSEMMLTNIDNLLGDPALGQALGIEGFLREPFVKLKLDTETGRVKGRLDQIKGAVFLQAFESLKGGGQITELEGIKAEQARARLSTAVSEEDFREALQELRFYTEQGIRRLKGEQIPESFYEDSKKQSDPLGIRS